MILNVGDIIICNVNISEKIEYGGEYEIIHVRPLTRWVESDVCIKDDLGNDWWFGQIGSTEPWTMFFTTKTQWDRDEKLNIILDEN